ncbi:MAG: glycosyltransferase family 2 protein [Kiritimatiellae bacterium]|nr:glycosyltransferase family 2 protein [Kiritimatiellia bacterium]
MKISVIIPLYNSSATIARTIASLKAQTLEGCEFILVDDFSCDNSVEQATLLTNGDSRFSILTQPYRTDPFQARTRGINSAKGEYVMFLDADDEFTPDACEIAYKTITEQNVDIFCFGSTVIGTPNTSLIELKNTQKHLDCAEGFSGKISGSDAVKDFYFKNNKFGTSIALWKKVFRRAILVEAVNKVVPTAPLRYGQDLLQLIITMLHTQSIYVDNSIKLHKYYLGAGGTQQGKSALSMSNFERMLTTKNSLNTLKKYFECHADSATIMTNSINNAHASYLNTCCGNFWYLKDEELFDGFNKLYSTWGEAIYTTPFFYSPANLIRFKRFVVQAIEPEKQNRLKQKLIKLFLSIPFYKTKLYLKILLNK